MKTTLFIMIIALLSNAIYSQNKLEKAKQYKENYEFSKAIALYEEISKKKDIKNPELIRDIAQSYIMINDMESARVWLEKINGLRVYSPKDLLNYAFALKSSAEYESAISVFNRYAELFPHLSSKVPQWIESCKQAELWINEPQLFNVQNLSDVNTPYSEFGITAFKDGFLFISDRKEEQKNYKPQEIYNWTGNPYLRVYHLPDLNNKDIHSEMDGINNTFHNGPVVFDKNSNLLYITKTKLQKVKAPAVNSNPSEFLDDNEDVRYINRLEIYTIEYIDGKWQNSKPFQYNNSEQYSVGHPALSPDGNILYFVSDMPGGYGKSDIWFCLKNADGTWAEPQNAGPIINTEDREMFPVVDKDGTFYFSSDGHLGMGGLDIFKTHGQQKNWTNPENLKYPINSPKDDFLPFFTEPGKIGYLSSNRKGGKGSDDIYFFAKQIVLKINTFEQVKNKLIPLPNTTVAIEKPLDQYTTKLTTDLYGENSFITHYGSAIVLKADKEGYLGTIKNIDAVSNSDTINIDLILDKIEINKTFVLENIYYDFDKWNIRPDAAIELDKLVNILKEHPEIDIELSSHTDSRGSNPYNKSLSQRRAESAVSYIISKGIDPKRIVAKGYGEEKLREPCPDGINCTEEQHQKNRRTEFTITNIRK